MADPLTADLANLTSAFEHNFAARGEIVIAKGKADEEMIL